MDDLFLCKREIKYKQNVINESVFLKIVHNIGVDISGRKILKYILLLTVFFCYSCDDFFCPQYDEKMGIVVFSGAVMRQCPLTYDLQTLKMFLQSVETN
jgi:hypothetical protein